MIKSFVPGRVRVRHDDLKNQKKLDAFIKALVKLPAVGDVSASSTGSVVIRYDKSAIPAATEQEFSKEMHKLMPKSSYFAVAPRKGNGKGYYRTLAVLFAGCLLSPALGLMRLHVGCGAAFSVLALKHICDYKKKVI